MRAYRISERAAGAGFDWNSIGEVFKKVEEELGELKAAIANRQPENVALEFGDVLFTLVNIARFAKIHPEPSLSDAIRKFEKRFRHMEQAVSNDTGRLRSMTRDQIDALWESAKKSESGEKNP